MRPTKARTIEYIPEYRCFHPAREVTGNPTTGRGADAGSITIGLDMLEAMRLVDVDGMTQGEAARNMDVSAPTLCRILGQGRRLAALALTTGKIIKLEGGIIMYGNTIKGRHGHRWCRGQGGQAECTSQAPGQMCPHGGAGRGKGKGRGKDCGQRQCASDIACDDNADAASSACIPSQEPL